MTTPLASSSLGKIIYYYPTAQQYPIDDVCSEIVSALEKHEWQVPGMEVEFLDAPVDSTTYRRVSFVKGNDFRIWFCRRQNLEQNVGRVWSDLAAVSQVNIPRKELNVYNAEAGPTLYVYVGQNWEVDRREFARGVKTCSKKEGKPRTYLKYTGRSNGMEGVRAESLVADNDSERDYSPENGEPTFYKTQEVFEEFVSYLRNHVLKKIENFKAN